LPHIRWWWCSVTVVVERASDVDVLAYAVEQR